MHRQVVRPAAHLLLAEDGRATYNNSMQISSEGFWGQIGQNRVLLAGFVAWATAQSIKVLLGVLRERRFNFRWFVGSGGMPSSHAALVTAAAVAMGQSSGFSSGIFAAFAIFAFIIMFDAQGVRRQSGKQAEALNRILDDVYAQRGLKWEPLAELFGHTPVQVIAGALIGVFVSLLLM